MRIVFLLILLIAAGCSKSPSAGPLRVQPPLGWNFDHKGEKGVDLYMLNSSDKGLLIFGRWPAPNRPEEIPKLVKVLGETFVSASNTKTFRLIDKKFTVEPFAGLEFSGNYVRFRGMEGTNEVFVALFMMSDGGTIWNGQYSGKVHGWSNALEILKSVRRQ